MTTDTLLIEIGTEELPPKSLKQLAKSFYQTIKEQLDDKLLSYTAINWYATPRRLAVSVEGLINTQQDTLIEKRGPATSIAFDENGNPSKAAMGWAKSNGITVDEAERLSTDKGEWLLYKATEKGKSVSELIPAMVERAINKLPIPKPMRWGSESTQFIRPVHTLTIMYGEKIIDAEILGVTSSNVIQGHRFHHHGILSLSHAAKYQQELLKAHVVVDYEARKETIEKAILEQASALNGKALIDNELLEEVTSLVEWPVILVGEFDEAFLQVPPEPLIYSMKDHQKYFPVMDDNGQLKNKFIFVANIESKDPTQVIKGNEKVVRPRLSDAEFFFKTDKKQTLESRLPSLGNVLFQKQLGTLQEKSERISLLSEYIAQLVNDDTAGAKRAGLLCKTDLMSDMVLEFPQVQGTMGKYYALNDGEPEAVAQALEDQYKPRFAGDKLPTANIGCAVAIADKIDSLVGIFGINQPPKGDKDPFALRRAAIGLIRIIIEKSLNLDIKLLIAKSIALYGGKLLNKTTEQDVIKFVNGRFNAYYQEQGISGDVIQAVMAKHLSIPLDIQKRIEAVSFFKTLPEASNLAAANKRVGNIVAKHNGTLNANFDVAIAEQSEETDLYNTFVEIDQLIKPMMADRDYQSALTQLSKLKTPIDAYLDNVMVMTDNEAIKTNRLSLLNNVRNRFFEIADISVLQ